MATYLFNTFGEVVDDIFSELGVDSGNSFPGLSQEVVEKWANRDRKEFIDDVRMKTGETTSGFVTVSDTTLSAEVASGGVSATITSSSGWPASGLCVIADIPFTFTRSGTTLTIPAAPCVLSSGAVVQLGYPVPSTFLRPQSLFVEGTKYALARRGDLQNVPPQSYIIYSDFFILPVATSGDQKVVVHFYKKWSDDLVAADTLDIADIWDQYVIAKGTARGHRVLYDSDRAQEYEQMAATIKKSAKAHFARQDTSTENMFRPGF